MPVSGPYLGTWGGFGLGTQDDNGYQLSVTVQGQEINASDAYGMTLVEAIYRGQNWKLAFNGLEWAKTGLLSALQMFGFVGAVFPVPFLAATTLSPVLLSGAGGATGTAGGIGDRWSKYCKSLVLTSILTSPPSTPTGLTAETAGLTPNSQTLFKMTSQMREMPLEFVLIPYQTTSGSLTINVPFVTTG